MSHRSLVCAELSDDEAYGLLTSSIHPRPVGLVSTVDTLGAANVAPFSFLTVGGVRPASIVYCPTLKADGTPKDSLRNVREVGEFTLSLVSRAMAERLAAATVPKEEDEWRRRGLSPAPSERVRPAWCAESPIAFECRVHTIVSHGSGPHAANYVVGEVLLAHVEASLLEGNVLTPIKFAPVARLGGPLYLDPLALETFSIPDSTAPVRTSEEQ